jgi:ammonia channel protein AmtB
MTRVLSIAAVAGVVSAVAVTFAQELCAGDVNPAITGGVAGGIAGAIAAGLSARRRRG